MISFDLGDSIVGLQSLPPAFVGGALLLVALMGLGGLYRFFGPLGVCVYSVLAILVANLQVLKLVSFAFFPHPVAMGTAVFSTLFLATDLLTEQHGPIWAKRAIYLGFIAQALFTALMVLTLGVRMAPDSVGMQAHLSAVFMPGIGLFFAGLIAFGVSQLYDVYIYQALKVRTSGRHLWLRAGVSYLLAALLDNVVFSLLAWRVFAPVPVEWSVILNTYIIGTYGLRVGFGLVNIFVLYLFKQIKLPC